TPSAPVSTPRFESPAAREEAPPSEFRAPRISIEPARIEPQSTRNKEPQRPDGEQNPFTGLKLEAPSQALRTAQSFPAENRAPSSSPTPPNGNPFEAPNSERGPAFNPPATQRFAAPRPEASSPAALNTSPSLPDVPEPPKLSAPESRSFEAPTRTAPP